MKFGVLSLIILAVFASSEHALRNDREFQAKKNLTVESLQDSIPELMKQALIPGLSMAIIRDAKILMTAGFGTKNIESKEPVTDTTIFEAASLSKPVFAYAVLRLVERGQLDLDRPLIEYVSDKYVEENFLQRSIDDERFRKITARMVLNHSSGFPNWRNNEPLKINFEPGEKYNYSGEGFGYLQRVVEYITNKSLDEFMKDEVFEPLQMKHSGYIWQDYYQNLTAFPHDLMMQARDKQQREIGHAAASLHTTASDFAQFMLALLNHTGLEKSTIDQMLSPQIIARPELTQNISWGLGIGLEETDKGLGFWHWGDNFNFRCMFIGIPKEKSGVIYFTNSYNGLAIRKEIVSLTIGGKHSIFEDNYLANYGSSQGNEIIFIRNLREDGIDAAIRGYQHVLNTKNDIKMIPERSMNSIGYYFMRKEDYPTAIRIFKLNVKAYPDAWNVYDSLGEAYMENGNIELAIKNYQKSLDINPQNENASKILKQLKDQQIK